MSAETFVWKGRFGPMELDLSATTFPPTSVSTLLADVLEVAEGDTVIDVGCGSGILAIVAAKLGAGRVVGVDSAPDVIDVAGLNAARHGVDDVTEFYRGNLFEPLPEDVRADVVIGDVSGIPDSFAAISGWFPSGRGGGPRGSELPISMLEQAKSWLRPGGHVFLPTGDLQDESAILGAARNLYGSLTQLVERYIPLPGKLAESPALLELVKQQVIRLTPRGSRFLWGARVWRLAIGD